MDLIELIETAIEDERRAQQKYAEAAKSASDPEIRAFFAQMVREEQAHESRLKNRLLAVKLLGQDKT